MRINIGSGVVYLKGKSSTSAPTGLSINGQAAWNASFGSSELYAADLSIAGIIENTTAVDLNLMVTSGVLNPDDWEDMFVQLSYEILLAL